jgi:hypothetical protein
MKGAHYRVRNMSRLHFALFLFGLCLFGLGIGIVSANANVSRVSDPTTTTFVLTTTTTTTQVMTTTTADITRPKPTVLHQRAEIGTALSIARETTTTTTTEAPKTPLEVAQSQVGKTGPTPKVASGAQKRLVTSPRRPRCRGSSPPMAHLPSTRMPSPMGGLPISQRSASWCSSTSSVPEGLAMAK